MITNKTIYIYYHKTKMALYALGCVAILTVYIFKVYDDVMYRHITYAVPHRRIFSTHRHVTLARIPVPFVLPGSLYRISLWSIIIIFIMGCSLLFMIKRLLLKHPAFVITCKGITDHKNRFISWKEVRAVHPFVYNKNHKCVIITLHNSRAYFGTYTSLFGIRPIVLDSSIMYFHELDALTEISKRLKS